MKNDNFGFLSIRLLMLTAFYDFLSLQGDIPENNVKIIWLIWNLVHIIDGY